MFLSKHTLRSPLTKPHQILHPRSDSHQDWLWQHAAQGSAPTESLLTPRRPLRLRCPSNASTRAGRVALEPPAPGTRDAAWKDSCSLLLPHLLVRRPHDTPLPFISRARPESQRDMPAEDHTYISFSTARGRTHVPMLQLSLVSFLGRPRRRCLHTRAASTSAFSLQKEGRSVWLPIGGALSSQG